MKKLQNIWLCAALAFGLGSCANEAPFSERSSGDMGRFLTSSLSVDVKYDESLVRSVSVPDVNDFTVVFYSEDGSVVKVNQNESNSYGNLPEIVELPVGKYSVKAFHGDNIESAFESPYYEGNSETFEIQKDRIVDNIKPIVCSLSNVRVTIKFDSSLRNTMSSDSKVTVVVGDKGTLDFTKDHEDKSESGYFQYVENSNTLAATFTGTVDEEPISVQKTYDDVKPGNHYIITFKMQVADPNEPGNLNPGAIEIVSKADIVDVDGNITPSDDDEYLDDPDKKDDPIVDPDPPVNPDEPTGNGPTLTAEDPIDLDIENHINGDTKCKLHLTSETGIKTCEVDIESESLTPEELSGVGLASHLDLINPGELEAALQGLGFPVGDQVSDQKTVDFDISRFMGLLCGLGSGTHKFIFNATDESGKLNVTLILVVD